MDEIEFKNHAEKIFWENCYLASLRAGANVRISQIAADTAIHDRRARMVRLVRPGVKAA